jgi:Asp-tRNA(Asn)/Glu-tRNA(Gln) amidotransferase A subunit family amidase
MTELWRLSASEIARRIDAGDLTCEAVTAACLERIEDREPEVEAWIYLDKGKALADARAIDAGPSQGMIRGVPVGVKDIIDTKDMPTGHGTIIHTQNHPSYDAPCVAQCRAEGGLMLGKTVTSEFAHLTPGKTKNPHNPAHSPAGSSSGSGAAVADFMVPVAFGTQTGGSIVRPAAFNGCIGYKPSYGDYNPLGVHDNSRSVDTLGMLTRTMEDQALMRAAVMGLPYRPLEPVSVFDLKIGLCRTPHWEQADAATHDHVEGAAVRLSEAGADVSDFDLPDGFDGLEEAFDVVSAFEFSRALAYEWHNYRDKLSDRVKEERLELGWSVTYAAYRAGLAALQDYRNRFHASLEGYDLLITPSATGEAPADLTTIGQAHFNRVWTALYSPGLSLPLFTGPLGLPIGLQVIGHLGDDERFLDTGDAVFRALG